VFKGLGNLANLGSLMRQAQQMGGRMEQMKEELKGRRAEGTAGGAMVRIETNGLGEVLRCQIDPSIATDRELIEDLVPAAVNQALAKSRELHAEAMKALTAGLELPGLDSVLAQLSGDGNQKPSA
jgi:DNA-binding YbaB/EbfC family protein